jgi:hypothetical protein
LQGWRAALLRKGSSVHRTGKGEHGQQQTKAEDSKEIPTFESHRMSILSPNFVFTFTWIAYSQFN